MDVSYDNIYILNPAYFLRNDVYRAIIGTFDFPQISTELYDRNVLHIIHPMHAQMLSFFDGKRNLEQCIECISNYFELTKEEVNTIIVNYIDNKESLCIQYNEDYIFLPSHILIAQNSYIRSENYNPEDFEIIGDVDLKTRRLYKPIKVIIEMNFNCYTDCVYCYADRNNPKAKILMPLNNMLSLIREMKQLKIPSLEINGGEILLHPHIKEILTVMSECGYMPFISTKIPLSLKHLGFLKSIGIRNIQISLDSINEDSLMQLLRVKAGYMEKILNTMNYLDELDFDWQVNTVLTKVNSSIEEELKPLFSFLSQYKNLKSIKINPLGFSMHKAPEMFTELRTDLEAIEQIKMFIKEFARENEHIEFIIAQPNCKSDYTNENKCKNFNERAICSANQKGFVVMPNGEVSICEELYWNSHFIIGNVINQSIMEIWNSPKAKKLFFIDQESISNNSSCKTCSSFNLCRYNKGICWKMVIMAYGQDNWDYPDPACPKAISPIIPFYY